MIEEKVLEENYKDSSSRNQDLHGNKTIYLVIYLIFKMLKSSSTEKPKIKIETMTKSSERFKT